jgi:CHAT domain-containing protein
MAIAAAWPEGAGPARVLTGAEAGEAALKRDAPGRTVLHLATHGIVVADSCGPAIPGTRGVGGLGDVAEPAKRPSPATIAPAAAPESPRRESVWSERQVWLALAGANRPLDPARGADEGLLTAEEVATLDLRETDWVVLSACHSGLATAWGREGVLGMGRAFLLAGARGVIAARWPVGDESAREWMMRLYEARARGLGAGAAVRAAARATLAARRASGRSTHPFHWAAFTASGD